MRSKFFWIANALTAVVFLIVVISLSFFSRDDELNPEVAKVLSSSDSADAEKIKAFQYYIGLRVAGAGDLEPLKRGEEVHSIYARSLEQPFSRRQKSTNETDRALPELTLKPPCAKVFCTKEEFEDKKFAEEIQAHPIELARFDRLVRFNGMALGLKPSLIMPPRNDLHLFKLHKLKMRQLNQKVHEGHHKEVAEALAQNNRFLANSLESPTSLLGGSLYIVMLISNREFALQASQAYPAFKKAFGEADLASFQLRRPKQSYIDQVIATEMKIFDDVMTTPLTMCSFTEYNLSSPGVCEESWLNPLLRVFGPVLLKKNRTLNEFHANYKAIVDRDCVREGNACSEDVIKIPRDLWELDWTNIYGSSVMRIFHAQPRQYERISKDLKRLSAPLEI